MNFNLEKNFPTFINKQESKSKKQSEVAFLKSLGKKAVPYIAALTALLSTPTFSEAQEKSKDNSNIVWTLKSPDGKQTKTFNTKEERDAFARAHNLNIPSENSGYEKDTRNDKAETNNRKAEWKLTSPDGKQTKTFNTKEERDAFARANNISLPESLNKEEDKVAQKRSPKTSNYQNLIENAPEGKSKIIQINSDNNAKIYKVKKEGKKIKIKEDGDIKVVRDQD
jgi:hypothetical protein